MQTAAVNAAASPPATGHSASEGGRAGWPFVLLPAEDGLPWARRVAPVPAASWSQTILPLRDDGGRVPVVGLSNPLGAIRLGLICTSLARAHQGPWAARPPGPTDGGCPRTCAAKLAIASCHAPGGQCCAMVTPASSRGPCSHAFPCGCLLVPRTRSSARPSSSSRCPMYASTWSWSRSLARVCASLPLPFLVDM